MKKHKTTKYCKQRKKELANRKAKRPVVTPAQLPENKPVSPAQKAFGGL